CRERPLGRKHGGRPLSPGTLYLVSAHEPLSDADDVRRAGFERHLHPPRPVEYAPAGPDAAERPGVSRMRPDAWPADVESAAERLGITLEIGLRSLMPSRSAA